ncbi:MAG TPA: YARHG domain-containing protein [Lachnospiraceae bacterium]|nr:YARHG domain-containing protein [Lachnospiraceae bacterium]
MRKIIYVAAVMSLLCSGCGVEVAVKNPIDTGSGILETGSQIESTEQKYETTNEEKGTTNNQMILDSWDLSRGDIPLSRVVDNLTENHITYTGLYNLSEERLDLTLSDGTNLLFIKTRDSEMNDMGYMLMMKNQEFNKNGFQEDYLNAYDVITDEYYFPDLVDRLLTEDDLWSMNKTNLSILRNQIYARHGRKFKDSFLNAVFSQKSWYEPVGEGQEFDSEIQNQLTETEKQNLQNISNFEQNWGYITTGEYSVPAGVLSGSSLDLDGDGYCEQLTYSVNMEGEDFGCMTLQVVDGYTQKTVAIQDEDVRLHEHCYIACMDQKEWFIIVGSDGPSADYSMNFYRYQDGKLENLGIISSDFRNLRVYPDKMTAYEETYHIQCEPLLFDFVIQNGTITRVEKEYYEYQKNEVVANMTIPLYAQKQEKEVSVTLQPGDKVIISGGDLKEWVLLEKKATGEKGWLKVISGQCYLPDGTIEESSLCFDGLYFYG